MDIRPTAKFLPVFAYKRFIQKPRIPGFIVRSSINTYDLKYSAEQTPYWQSRVTLGATRDKLGLPQLEVDYRIRDTDLESIHIAHKLIGQELRAQGIGELTFKAGDALLEIERQIGDGVHQIGTTRMSNAPSNGVVDRNCRVHGIQNLFIASSAVFPTSGHANPTLTIVALAARLADHLKAQTTSTRTPS
jgi:choline dehydrogenase-like flavoprotein